MIIPKTLLALPEWIAAQDPMDWLTPQERAHCATAASQSRRQDRLAGRLALKRLLWETFEIEPLAWEVGASGPAPILSRWPGPAGIVVSLSHSSGLGAASWAWEYDEQTVGVDAERVRATHPRLAARVLTDSEQSQEGDVILFWALKEAAIKARRQRWTRALREIQVTLQPLSSAHGTARIALPGEPDLTAWYERQGEWWLARAARYSI